jgi:hypothetical protein
MLGHVVVGDLAGDFGDVSPVNVEIELVAERPGASQRR